MHSMRNIYLFVWFAKRKIQNVIVLIMWQFQHFCSKPYWNLRRRGKRRLTAVIFTKRISPNTILYFTNQWILSCLNLLPLYLIYYECSIIANNKEVVHFSGCLEQQKQNVSKIYFLDYKIYYATRDYRQRFNEGYYKIKCTQCSFVL